MNGKGTVLSFVTRLTRQNKDTSENIKIILSYKPI